MSDLVSSPAAAAIATGGGLITIVGTFGGLLWRASSRVATLTGRIEGGEQAIKDLRADIDRRTEKRDEQIDKLNVRHESLVTQMSTFREYVGQHLVTNERLSETEGRLSREIREQRDFTGQHILELGKRVDLVLARLSAG